MISLGFFVFIDLGKIESSYSDKLQFSEIDWATEFRRQATMKQSMLADSPSTNLILNFNLLLTLIYIYI